MDAIIQMKTKYWVFVLSLVAGTSWAQSPHSVSVQYTMNKTDAACDHYDDTVINPAYVGSCDDDANGFRLGYGYSFNDTLSLDIGYQDFGSVGWDGTYQPDPYFTASFDASATGFDAGLKANMNINDTFALFGRAGLLFWDVDAKQKNQAGTTGSGSDSGNSFFFGVGLTAGWFELSYTTYPGVGDKDETGEADIDQLAAGVRFRF